MRGIRKFLVFLLMIPFLLGLTTPTKYSTLSDVQFQISEQLEGVTIYRPYSSTYTSDFVQTEMRAAELYMNKFVKIHRLPTDECQDIELGVFVVSSSVVNDLERYPTTTNQVTTRWALYDPYRSDSDYAAIVITDRVDTKLDKILLTHELGHYWHDACGWNDDWNGDTEHFAMAFQDFYTLDRYGRRY